MKLQPFDAIEAAFGGVDVLINSASIMTLGPDEFVSNASASSWISLPIHAIVSRK